jgi:hypothetical protein
VQDGGVLYQLRKSTAHVAGEICTKGACAGGKYTLADGMALVSGNIFLNTNQFGANGSGAVLEFTRN